jgi:hypothetical protein
VNWYCNHCRVPYSYKDDICSGCGTHFDDDPSNRGIHLFFTGVWTAVALLGVCGLVVSNLEGTSLLILGCGLTMGVLKFARYLRALRRLEEKPSLSAHVHPTTLLSRIKNGSGTPVGKLRTTI